MRAKSGVKRQFSAPIAKESASFLVIAGLILGTVFCVGMHYWEASVTKDEAIRVRAVYSSFQGSFRRGHLREILIRFQDHEQLSIVGVCLNSEVVQKVEALQPGTVLELYVHPNSSTILEMSAQGDVILTFDETVEKLSAEVSGFMVLGIFMYLFAAAGAFKLIRKQVY